MSWLDFASRLMEFPTALLGVAVGAVLIPQLAAAKARISILHETVFSTMASPDWTETAATTVDVTLASRYFERFGDHGVSVARKVSYLVTGEWQPEDFLTV